jgi:iron complex transport system ATP-binding protein
MISIDLKSAFYATQPVLKDISLTLHEGELVVLLGANGGGKSTLIRCLAGLHAGFTGTCQLNGKQLSSWPLKDRADHLSYLPQSTSPGFSFRAEEVILLARYRRLRDESHQEQSERLQQVARMWDVRELLSRPVDQLSGGEWQRVAIARTLMQDASLLLLDEPTAHLDLAHRLSLFQCCRDLARSGKGILCATHDLDAALEYADRIVVLHAGEIEADGPAEEVLTTSLVEKLFGSVPVEVIKNPYSQRPQLVLRSGIQQEAK